MTETVSGQSQSAGEKPSEWAEGRRWLDDRADLYHPGCAPVRRAELGAA